jgi:hypothetical protein
MEKYKTLPVSEHNGCFLKVGFMARCKIIDRFAAINRFAISLAHPINLLLFKEANIINLLTVFKISSVSDLGPLAHAFINPADLRGVMYLFIKSQHFNRLFF